MPDPTVSKLPELVILCGPLSTTHFSARSAAIFHANMITGHIWPRVHGQLCPSFPHIPVEINTQFNGKIWHHIKTQLHAVLTFINTNYYFCMIHICMLMQPWWKKREGEIHLWTHFVKLLRKIICRVVSPHKHYNLGKVEFTLLWFTVDKIHPKKGVNYNKTNIATTQCTC